MEAMNDKLNPVDATCASINRSASVSEGLNPKGVYKATLIGPVEEFRPRRIAILSQLETLFDTYDPTNVKLRQELQLELDSIPMEEKWSDVVCNLVTTVGKNLALDTILAGSSYTAAVVMGLKGTGTALAADTQSSHGSWSEVGGTNAPAYSGTRKTPAWSSASAGSKATSSASSFTFTSGGTVAGCFLNLAGSATIDNTTGTLYSAGDFTGGNKTVASSDVLNVSYTGSM
jgi:hypothetical protein